MTQFSWPWTCTATGDGGSASFSLDVVRVTNQMLTNADQTGAGVIYWTDSTVLPFTSFSGSSNGLLAPTTPGGSTINIASGVGLVQGWLYASDATVPISVAGGNANATDLIVLERDVAAQTVRLAHVQGAVSTKAVVTQNSAIWQIAIAEAELDGAGALSILTDVRRVVRPPVGSMVLIETIDGDGAGGITFSSIPPIFTHLRIVGSVLGNTPAVALANITMTFNADVTASYDSSAIVSQNAAVNPSTSTAANAITLGNVTGGSGVASARDMLTVDIADYSDTDLHKAIQSRLDAKGDGTTGANGLTNFVLGGWWRNTGAITSIELAVTPAGSFSTTSKVSLYGIAG